MLSIPADSEALVPGSADAGHETEPSPRRRTRVLTVDRGVPRPGAPTVTPALRSLVERAVVDAANAWNATATADAAVNGAYEQISILGAAITQVLTDGTIDLRGWPATAPIREPIDRLRRALLEQMSTVSVRVRSEDTLTALRALDRVHDLSQRDNGRRFAEQLSTGNALDLVVGVAHDMRSPLSSILFLVESLRNVRREQLTPIEERQLGLVYGAAMGLNQLVGDVIELARGCDRLLDRQPVPFSVSELVNSVHRMVQPIAEEKRLAIYLVLPEVDARVGYPAALSRVILNLVTNALKFTDNGYVEVTTNQLSRSRVEFSVRDTGPGIRTENLAALYQALRPRDRTTGTRLSGAGLGLSICQTLVAAMGGELEVETEMGQGTRFHFVLDLPPAAKI